MYRAPDTTPRCVACGGQSLTPETKFDPSEGWAYVHFAEHGTRSPLFGGGDRPTLTPVRFAIDRARVCLDCGHVKLSMSSKTVAKLRADLANLQAFPEE